MTNASLSTTVTEPDAEPATAADGATSTARAEFAPIPAGIPAQAPGALIVDLDALKANYTALRERAAPAECAAVVKADAYGIGAARAAPALARSGCTTFFVATLEEARAVRTAVPRSTVYVLGGLYPDAAPVAAGIGVRPVLGSIAEIEEWAGFCAKLGRRLPAALHLDTGMRRLGLPPDEAKQLAERKDLLARFETALVMTHMACADEPGRAVNASQRTLFDELRRLLPSAPASLANSAATLSDAAYRYDLVRPGIALYGGEAVNDAPNPMKPVVRILARIVQIRDVATGDGVGYGHAFKAKTPMRLATVAAGYADGLHRRISTADPARPLAAIIDGHAAPIVGRISMDLTILDVTDVPQSVLTRGSFAELCGSATGIDALARHAGTIGYELLTQLGRRYHRIYLGDSEDG